MSTQNVPEIKIITFKLYRDVNSWYAKSDDSNYMLGYMLEFNAETKHDIFSQIQVEINELFFDEYDVDFFMSEHETVEILLTKNIPLINIKEPN